MGSKIESRELIVKWQRDHDQRAREELVERFLPLARKLARRYSGTGEPFDDLLQVASFGLLKALDRFDPGRGTAFSSFAVPTILGELKRYFRDLGWSVHVPRAAQEMALKVQEARSKLSAGTGRSPTPHEVAQFMELSVEQVVEGLEASAAHHSISLQTPRDDGDGEAGMLADTLGAQDDGFELVDERVTVAAAMGVLSERDQYVLMLRFFEERTQSEIARELGISQMQISRILRRATARLAEAAETPPGLSAGSDTSVRLTSR
jgi:RNA polymerase sigma-B factor